MRRHSRERVKSEKTRKEDSEISEAGYKDAGTEV